MGTYKVLQDIEAEDKLLGPLSLRQFVYAAIVVVCLFISFKLVTANVWFLTIPLLPIIVFFGMLAAPFGHDQSNEIWLLAKIRFALKPRKRLWDQSGIKELVTITVPKKIEKHLTKDFSKIEAKSRLEALANTIDSRGWAVKNVSSNPFRNNLMFINQTASDRLVDMSQVFQAVPDDTTEEFDILDYHDNPNISHVDQLIDGSTQTRQQKIESIVESGRANYNEPSANTQWFAENSSTAQPVITQPVIVSPSPAQNADDDASQRQGPLPVITANDGSPIVNSQSTSVTGVDPAIIDLASNDDLNVATLARQADKAKAKSDDNEVVISLH